MLRDPAASATHLQRRRIITVSVLTVAGLIVLVLGTIGLLIGPPDPASDSGSNASEPRDRPSTDDEPSRGQDVTEQELPVTDDPEEFARAVAVALFAWDTTDGYLPRDYAEIIVQAGVSDQAELNGLAHDVTTYLPTDQAWVELQKYETRQHLEIDHLGVPEQWPDVLEQARDDAILPGTTAYTVEGVRHRAGVWNGEDVETEHPVAFTIFLLCEGDGEACQVLRLSALDKPLT